MLVIAAGLTTALGLAPVYLHRGLFRRGLKAVVVRVGDIILRIELVGIAVVLTGTQLLIFDVVASRAAGLAAASVTALLVLVVALLPRLLRRAARRDQL